MNDTEPELTDLIKKIEETQRVSFRNFAPFIFPVIMAGLYGWSYTRQSDSRDAALYFQLMSVMLLTVSAFFQVSGKRDAAVFALLLTLAKGRRDSLRIERLKSEVSTQPQRGELSQPGATPRVPDTQNP